MTDNEIIKALEEEIHLAEYVDTSYVDNVSVELLKNTLDLITRQKAEIEKLKSRNNFLEIEYKNQGNLFWERVNTAKSEAIREFAEKLKTKAHNYYPSIDSYCVSRKVVLISDIDNLVKERGNK